MFQRKIAQSHHIICFDRHVFDARFKIGAGVTGSDENFAHQWRLRHFPGDGMFAATAADDEYIHPLDTLLS